MAKQLAFTWEQLQALKNKGILTLTAPTSVEMTLQDTYYPITGTYVDMENCGVCVNFTPDGLGTIEYEGVTIDLDFSGTSDIEIDGNQECRVVFGLFKNGVLIEGAETPTTFNNFNSVKNISITGFIEQAEDGDVFDIRRKCEDDAGRTLTINTLNAKFKGA